jgi:hypothetical protein
MLTGTWPCAPRLRFYLDGKPQGGPRPGGRTARTRAAVLRAVLDELAGGGYAGTTVERVAARAGIAKTTIYRRCYLTDHRQGRRATVAPDGSPQNKPVSYRYNADEIKRGRTPRTRRSPRA